MFILTVISGMLFLAAHAELLCPEGWHKHRNNQCYWFSDFNATRDNAKLECESKGGILAIVNTSSINTFLSKYLSNDSKFWIGLRIVNAAGSEWRWSNGDRLGRQMNWCDDSVPSTACAAVQFPSNNNNNPCLTSFACATASRFICETDKLSSCPQGWNESNFEENIKCLSVSVDRTNIKNASSFCWQNVGRLMTVNNIKDTVYLNAHRPGPADQFWVGISPYRWDDGTGYNWHNWDSGGPSVGELCTVVQQDGIWHNGICSEDLNNFICEKGATMTSTNTVTATTPTTTGTSEETSASEIVSFTSSELPSTSSVSMLSNNSTLPTLYATHTPKAANGSGYTDMFWQDYTPTTHSKLAMNMMIGVYSAVGVVFVIFLGLLAQCLVLRKRHISRMKNMSMEQETQFSKMASHDLDGDDDCIYDSPEIVQIDNVEQSRRTSSDAAAHNTILTEVRSHVDDTNCSTTQEKSHGQETIAQTISSSTKTTASEDSIKDHGIINTEQTQLTVTDTATSSAGMAHTSVFPGHVFVNGEVYAEVDMSRKTIGYDDVILPQAVMNNNYEHSTNNEIVSSTCSKDANGQTDAENTSESIYYNESAQPIYSNDDSDHNLENQYNNAVPSDKCDTDNSLNDEETYANCGEETGGVAYTEVDLSEPTSNMPITEEESVVYSDIKM